MEIYPMKRTFRARNQKGFTIIEFMVVVALIGALTTIIGAGLLRANKGSVVKRITDDVVLYAAQASNYRGAQTAYTGVSVANLITQGLLSANAATNPAGGAYTVAPNGTDPTTVDIGADGLGDDTCAAVAHKFTTGGNTTAACTSGALTVTFN